MGHWPPIDTSSYGGRDRTAAGGTLSRLAPKTQQAPAIVVICGALAIMLLTRVPQSMLIYP
jgi:hypothetical protein